MVHEVAARVSLRSRERKLQLFLKHFEPDAETTVLDVGVTDAPFGRGPGGTGSSDNFFEALYPWPGQITAVGHTGLDRFIAAFPTVTAVQADGRELPFADKTFDIGFSNAVIEHVAGGRGEQRRFVEELCRVSKRVFMTTPNSLFPIDPHSLIPFVHWFPDGARRQRLLRARGFDDVLDPLGPRELAALFPYPVKLLSRGMTLVAVGPA